MFEPAKGYNGYSIDLYAAGKALLKMVCGTEVENIEDSPVQLSDELKFLLEGMLHIDPEERFTLEIVNQNEWVLDDSLQT